MTTTTTTLNVCSCTLPATHRHTAYTDGTFNYYCPTHKCDGCELIETGGTVPATDEGLTIPQAATFNEQQLELIDANGNIIADAAADEEAAKRDALRRYIESWQQDIAKISEALNELADEHDWCSEYDSMIEAVNQKLHFHLFPREVEYQIDFSGYGTAEITASFTMPVPLYMLDDEDEMKYLANDKIREAINYNNIEDAQIEVNDTEIDSINYVDYNRNN